MVAGAGVTLRPELLGSDWGIASPGAPPSLGFLFAWMSLGSVHGGGLPPEQVIQES